MRIDGLWRPDEEGAMCPVISGVIAISGHEYPIQFLVDTGAERTVLGSDFAEALEPHRLPDADTYLTSAAGKVDSFRAKASLSFVDTADRKITFELVCSVLTDPSQATTHLLGRDILDLFALICDREQDVVTLLRPPHTYTIVG